jgi:hypothetical protein
VHFAQHKEEIMLKKLFFSIMLLASLVVFSQPAFAGGYQIMIFDECGLPILKMTNDVKLRAELWMNLVRNEKIKIISHSLALNAHCVVLSVLYTEEK